MGQSERPALCSKCKGQKWLIVAPDGTQVPEGKWAEGQKAKPCECQRTEKIKLRIPRDFQDATLLDLKPALTDTLMSWFANPESRGLLLHGPAGTGKTHIACALVRALLETEQNARIVAMATVYRELRNCFNSDNSESLAMLDYITMPWLVLDDFGSGALTDFERRIAYEILNGRISQRNRTIITTNLKLDEIRDKLDERVSSRLLLFQEIELQGKDRRAA